LRAEITPGSPSKETRVAKSRAQYSIPDRWNKEAD
jgi:hypothetical protein